MNTLFEIFIMGFKRYGAEIVCSALIFISIWLFPRLRSFLKRSLRDSLNSPKPANNPETEILEDVPEEDYYAEIETSYSGESNAVNIPEWVNERRKEFDDIDWNASIITASLSVIATISSIGICKVFFPSVDEGLMFLVMIMIMMITIMCVTMWVNKNVQLEAERGNPYAQYYIGRMYRHPRKKAYQLSYVWYYLSGLCGYPKGYSEATKIENGGLFSGAKISSLEVEMAKTEALRMFNEIKQNRAVAFSYYRSKAWNGDSLAQYNLGYVYQKGEGTEQSDYNAYVWYSVAQLSGDWKAKSRLEKLKSKLFPSQVAQAEEEAKRKFNAIQQRKKQK